MDADVAVVGYGPVGNTLTILLAQLGRTVEGTAFDDVYGAGWRLVTVDQDASAIDPTIRRWFETIGGRVVPLPRPDDAHRRWFTEHATAWALQRPDFHLYGTATTAAEASTLLDALHGVLGPQ